MGSPRDLTLREGVPPNPIPLSYLPLEKVCVDHASPTPRGRWSEEDTAVVRVLGEAP